VTGTRKMESVVFGCVQSALQRLHVSFDLFVGDFV
jgi:hypothetical protein